MDLLQEKVLVTGASGFIGSHLVEILLDRGIDVTAFVKYESDGNIGLLEDLPQEKLEKLKIIRGDLKNIDSLLRATKDVSVVLHLGALISIPYSYEDPRDFVETNVIGTLNVLRASQENKVKKIVITSTSEVYGTADYSPIDEKHPLKAQSPYSATKIAADKLGESFYRSFNLPVATIRPFNTFGPRQSIRAVIPTIITQALKKDKIKLGSLTPRRDFVYVKDTAEAFIKVAESENSVGQTFNISSGSTISIGDLVEKISNLLGKKIEVETDEKKVRPEKSEVMLLIGESKKAQEEIEWKQNYSIDEGLKEVIDYVREKLEKKEEFRENL